MCCQMEQTIFPHINADDVQGAYNEAMYVNTNTHSLTSWTRCSCLGMFTGCPLPSPCYLCVPDDNQQQYNLKPVSDEMLKAESCSVNM